MGVERSRYSHAVMVLDYEGSGAALPFDELESEVDTILFVSWGSDAKAIVITPAPRSSRHYEALAGRLSVICAPSAPCRRR